MLRSLSLTFPIVLGRLTRPHRPLHKILEQLLNPIILRPIYLLNRWRLPLSLLRLLKAQELTIICNDLLFLIFVLLADNGLDRIIFLD